MTLSEEDFYLLALNSVEGIGSIRANILLNKFETSKNIFDAKFSKTNSDIQSIPSKILDQIISKSTLEAAEREILFCEKHKIEIVTINSSEYPSRLKIMDDKPLVLFKKGSIYPGIKRTIGIVGTRKSTDYGHKFLDNFFEELKSIRDICVISGCAYGIDHKAHSLSIDHKIPTIAVMGLALNKIYPSQNTNLANSILRENGGWMTETNSNDIATQGVFPRRNRIIAGLSDVLLVVETDIKGGSIITAKLANEYNKDVFALPGRVTDAQSRGCNDLIQKNMAQIINSPYDIIDFMNWSTKSNKKLSKTVEIDFLGSVIQKKVLELIRIHPKIDLENIIMKADLSHGQIIETLLELELEGLIRILSGNKYELI